MDDDIDNEEGGFVQRLRESPRTVSALIIILIVAAAIYAFSGSNDEAQTEFGASDESVAVDVFGDSESSEEVVGEEDVSEGDTADVVVDAPTTAAVDIELPEPSRTEAGYVEVAEAGNGVTHLARRATARWLEENQADYEVTKEHMIYIEDYIKDNADKAPLRLGEERMIAFDMIAEAVGSAKSLNEKQLQNLSQYTYVLG